MPTFELITGVESLATSYLATFAYLDPGTGSYALQLLMAGVFGGLFALKQSWGQLRVWFASVMPGKGNAAASIEPTD